MCVTGILPELNCDHDQLVCPFQTVTCQCVVIGMVPGTVLAWRLDSKLIAQFTHEGESIYVAANYNATGEMLQNGVSSNLSFVVQLQSGPVTLECIDSDGISNTWSCSIVGQFLTFVFPNQSII